MNRKNQLTLGHHDEKLFVPSTIPSTRDDLKQFEEDFHRMLYQDFALESGLCRRRRHIYDDFFNELIRITTVHCFERGQLLEQIRNEYKGWMKTYEELYSSSMAYGMRQYLYRMEEKKDLEITIKNLEYECQQLRDELEDATIAYERVNEKKEDQELNALRTDVQILRSSNQKIRGDLEKHLNQLLTSSIFFSQPTEDEEGSP